MLSLGEYVERNYLNLFTWPERAAWKHLPIVAKSTHGMSPEQAARRGDELRAVRTGGEILVAALGLESPH